MRGQQRPASRKRGGAFFGLFADFRGTARTTTNGNASRAMRRVGRDEIPPNTLDVPQQLVQPDLAQGLLIHSLDDDGAV